MGYLENLPDSVITKILPHLSHNDKLNFRKTSKRLFQIIKSSDPQFKVWSFYINKGIPPEFVLNSRKMFHVYIKDIDIDQRGKELAQVISMFLKSYANRIVNIDIKSVDMGYGNLSRMLTNLAKLEPEWTNLKNISLKETGIWQLEHLFECGRTTVEHLRLLSFCLTSINPLMFTCLKTLTLKGVQYAKIREVPQLEKLELIDMDYEFEIAKNTKLPKLKTLIICDSKYVNLQDIFTKCCSTVESVELNKNGLYMNFDPKGFKFPALKSFKFNGSGKNVINFISKACDTLTSLDLTLSSQVNFGPLTNKSMKLETIKFAVRNGSKNVVQFLNSCECLTSLELTGFCEPSVDNLDLKGLTTLRLIDCYQDFLKLLVEASKSSVTLKKLEITWINRKCKAPEFYEDDVLPVIKSLDVVSVLLDDPEDVQSVIETFAVLFEDNFQSQVERVATNDYLIHDRIYPGSSLFSFVATNDYQIHGRIYPGSSLFSHIQNEENRVVHTSVLMRRVYNLHYSDYNYSARNLEGPGAGRNLEGAGAGRNLEGAGAGRNLEGAGAGRNLEGAGAGRNLEGAGAGRNLEGPGAGRNLEGPGAGRNLEVSGAGRNLEGAGAGRNLEGPGAGRNLEGAGAGRNLEVPGAGRNLEGAGAGRNLEGSGRSGEQQYHTNTKRARLY